MVAIDGDENAKYGNSSDREEDIAAGGGAGDEVIKVSRCVFAAVIFMFGTTDTAVVGGGGDADGSHDKNDVVL